MDATGENDVALRYTLLGFLDKFQFLIWGTPNEAALKLHKFYKRFGTRWKLAGCAVLVEQRCYLLVFWSQNFWCYCVVVILCCMINPLCFNHRQKLLDFGEVKISYISFFDIKKHETVNSRWDLELGQEQMRLVKVCDLWHWYGHNLHFYYKLLHFKSRDLLLVITSHRLLFPHLCQKVCANQK